MGSDGSPDELSPPGFTVGQVMSCSWFPPDMMSRIKARKFSPGLILSGWTLFRFLVLLLGDLGECESSDGLLIRNIIMWF